MSCSVTNGVAMANCGGIHSEEHEAAFAAARALFGRGGPNAPICGARNRKGSICRQVPIKEGQGRCLSHAGPAAARAFRERQRRAFMAGKISADDWRAAEAKRAANSLRWAWKRNPWVDGATIDLGASEGALRAALGGKGLCPEGLPPAVLDWLRWRFQRVQIDRVNDGAWLRVLHDELPRRIERAGPRPDASAEAPAPGSGGRLRKDGKPDGRSRGALPLEADAKAWQMGAAAVSAGRRKSDKPKAPKVIRGKGYARPGRPRTQPASDAEAAALGAIYRENYAAVAPIVAACRTEADKLAALRVLRDYLAEPNAPGRAQRWMELVGAARRAALF